MTEVVDKIKVRESQGMEKLGISGDSNQNI